MPAGEALEDDYIISLLRKDADDHRKKYTTVGNGPLLSSAKRRADAPKPNTRFLKNIIRETDSHNAALKAKEEQDARARLRQLRGGDGIRKRKREATDKGQRDVKRSRDRESRPGRWASALDLDGARSTTARKERQSEQEVQRKSRGSGDSDNERASHRHRRSLKGSDERNSKQTYEHNYRPTRSRSRRRSGSPHHREEHHAWRRPRSRDPSRQSRCDPDDPLTEFLGPQPPSPTRPRGRGAFKPSSDMDSRFREDYNPTTDVALDRDEEDDWDMALEALKARTKWRTQGAERLRAAGFTEEEVERWEKGGSRGGNGEKDADDVRWRKRGEGREWDRGKVLAEDGEGIELKADWAKR